MKRGTLKETFVNIKYLDSFQMGIIFVDNKCIAQNSVSLLPSPN